MIRVLVLRGHQATTWELRQWEALDPARFAVRVALTPSNRHDSSALELETVPVSARRDRLPRGTLGDLAAGLAGDRYGPELDAQLDWADVVHAEELGYWFAAEAARRRRHRFRLVLTAWETIPMLDAYRNPAARRHRRAVLGAADLWLAATRRARDALLLEGVPGERIEVCPPGIDVARFGGVPRAPEALLVSPGRLVWEKGHQDVIRALALLRARGQAAPRLLVVGDGPERARLEAHARELGVGDLVELRAEVPYDAMPGVFARAAGVVLMSLPLAGGDLVLRPPRLFWEEQFGLVLAEALAARVPVVTTTSGAIPEVVEGHATLLAPGDWPGLAGVLAAGLPPAPDAAALVARYSLEAAGRRLAAAYERVLG